MLVNIFHCKSLRFHEIKKSIFTDKYVAYGKCNELSISLKDESRDLLSKIKLGEEYDGLTLILKKVDKAIFNITPFQPVKNSFFLILKL